MKNGKRLLAVVTSGFLSLTMTIAPMAPGFTNLTAFAGTELGDVGLKEVPDPIDPQSWRLHRDMTWDDLNPHPVVNWMKELNEDGLVNPEAAGSKDKIVGGLILIEYLDRKFISANPVGSDKLGYKLSKLDGSGLEDTITNNPVISVPRENLGQWWADYLNKPQEGLNHGLTIDEFWRENSYGKWAVDLEPYGPFTIPYFEFETMGYDIGSSFQTTADIPPTFRVSRGFDGIAIPFARDQGVPFKNFDFFFLLHAGYDESGVWQEFGQNQFKTRKDVPYELGPGPRMEQVEKVFTENPDLLDTYIARYTTQQVFKDAKANYEALKAAGRESEFVFKLPQADWDWVAGYNNQTAKNTRYVQFTSWEACVGEWSHKSTASASQTGAKSMDYSTQGENDGMSTFAHEFGHIAGLLDNYGNSFTENVRAATEPWDLMSRGSFAGPFGDHARWTVPGIEAGSVPVNFMLGAKREAKFYDANDLVTMTTTQLRDRTPVVAEVVARNVPLDTQYNTFGVPGSKFTKGILLNFTSMTAGNAGTDAATLQTSGYTNFRKRASSYALEVVDQTGYDSYLNDHGVLISRLTYSAAGATSGGSNPFRTVIDSHLNDIELIDYTLNGVDTYFPVAHQNQLADATFHAGVSTTDTGYYSYKTGKVVSGDTVNEWVDTANKLHFYILQNNLNEGKYGNFLSYQVGVRRTDGVPVNGELIVEKGELQPATAGRVAVQEFNITNTGDATDIVRIKLGGTLNYKTTILNNLYAIDAGKTITVPVYIEVPEAVGFAAASVPTVTLTSLSDADLTLTASSESNAAKTSTATVGDAANQSTVNRLIVTTDKAIVSTNEYFNVNVKFAEKVSSNTAILTYTFDTDKFEYRGLGLAPGVKALNTVVNGGTLKITVMVDDYDTLDYGNVLFSANGNIDLTNKANEILVNIQCVEKDANGIKTIKGADGGTVQLTGLQGDTNGDGKVDLIDLSNMIDWYGFNTNTPDWETKYVFYDFNRTGEIDISDVTKVAQLISL